MTARAPGATQLDRDVATVVRQVHDTYWESRILAANRKSVLLVEGDDDRDVVEVFLARRSRTFAARVRVVPAGGRSRVLERMKNTFPDAYGLVDRDTWDDAKVAELRREYPRLYVTEGWCLENTFLGPGALQRYGAQVSAALAAQRERWVRAGALWWTLQRAREAQHGWQEALDWSYGSPRDDLDLLSEGGLANSLDQKIPEVVRRASSFDSTEVAAKFAQRCTEILSLPEARQWLIGVHGKRAFTELLVAALRSTPQEARLDLADEIDRPPPLDDLVALLLP